MVPTPGCKAQIQEVVPCCGSTACAQHWSYPLLYLGKSISVTVGNTGSGVPDAGLLSSDMPVAPAAPCRSPCHSVGSLSCPATPASFMALPPWQTGKVISNFCSHLGISIARGSGTSLGSAAGSGTASNSTAVTGVTRKWKIGPILPKDELQACYF